MNVAFHEWIGLSHKSHYCSISVEVTVSLSVLSDSVPESNGAMLVLVDLDGEVAVDITVTVQTRMGTGRYCVDHSSVYSTLLQLPTS